MTSDRLPACTAHLQAVLKKADGQLEETLKEAGAFLKEKDAKGGEAGSVESSN